MKTVLFSRIRQLQFLAVMVSISLWSCTAHSPPEKLVTIPINRDTSCSYFYFLWGTHQEYYQRYTEALEAYRNALICDPEDAYIKRKLPLLYLKMDETDKAIAMLTKNLQDQKNDISQRTLLARIYIQQKKERQAIEQYRQVLSYEPENRQALLRLGILLSQTEQYDEAKRHLEKLLTVDKEAYFGRLYLARIADQQEKITEAEEHYTKALELNFSADLVYEIGEFYLEQNQFERVVELMRQLLDQDDTQQRARIAIVQALLALEREDEAIAELGTAQEYSKNPEKISLLLSRLHMKNGDNLKAKDNLHAILEVAENSEARYLLALILVEEKQYQEALVHLSAIGPFEAEFEDSVVMRSRIYHDTDQAAKGADFLESLLDNNDTRRELFYILAASLHQELSNRERSIETLARGVDIFPESERLLFEYGMQLERSGQLEEALRVMKRLLELNPDHPEALNFIGYSWADTDRNLEQALAYITRAMELKPGNGYIQDSFGWVHFKLGNLETARDELTEALALVPDDPHIYDHLGDVYMALNEPDKALKAYRSAFEYFEDQQKKEMVREKIEMLTDQ